MATYFHGAPEIHSDGLQTLFLMNPGYVGYPDSASAPAPAPAPAANMLILNSGGLNSLQQNNQNQHFVGIPVPPPTESSVGGGRFQYNLWNTPQPIGRSAALSLSLSPQRPRAYAAAAGAGETGGIQSVLMNSKYLKAAQELLDEVVSVGKGEFGELLKGNEDRSTLFKSGNGNCEGESSGKRDSEYTAVERQELQMKKAKLVSMLGEVEQRYRQYHNEMQIVVSSLEALAGHGSATTYTALALQTISRQFRCLRDAISAQVRAAGRSLGDEDCVVGGGGKSVGSRLRLVDHHLRQQRALQQLGMMQNNAWRPQRGLPERAVSILRAWLFEHFLHPYPKDSDKLLLAKQTGLTRSQVSNWFINARVRLWKPMVEEMYVEEVKEQQSIKPEEKNSYTEPNEDSNSKASSQTKTEQTTSFTSINPQDKSQDPNPPNPIPIPLSKFKLSHNPNKESLMQPFPKKLRNTEMKPEEFSNRELLMKFMEARNNVGNFNSYAIGEIGRFQAENFAPSFHNNGVSLTLGLQHCDSLSLTGTEQAYLSNESIQIGNEPNAFCSLNNNQQNSQTSISYESMDIQNRKRFAAQLLPDYVA